MEGWHRLQTPPAPPCRIGKLCAALQVAGLQALVEWQEPQALPVKPLWLAGLVWQPAQAVGVPLNTPPTWHFEQRAPLWAPVSLNAVREWSKEAGFQARVE